MEQNVAKFQRPGDLMWHQTIWAYITQVQVLNWLGTKMGMAGAEVIQWVITSNKLNELTIQNLE